MLDALGVGKLTEEHAEVIEQLSRQWLQRTLRYAAPKAIVSLSVFQ